MRGVAANAAETGFLRYYEPEHSTLPTREIELAEPLVGVSIDRLGKLVVLGSNPVDGHLWVGGFSATYEPTWHLVAAYEPRGLAHDSTGRLVVLGASPVAPQESVLIFYADAAGE